MKSYRKGQRRARAWLLLAKPTRAQIVSRRLQFDSYEEKIGYPVPKCVQGFLDMLAYGELICLR